MQEMRFPGDKRFAEVFSGHSELDVGRKMDSRARELSKKHGHPEVVKRRKIGRLWL